jgi:hypothetical protein
MKWLQGYAPAEACDEVFLAKYAALPPLASPAEDGGEVMKEAVKFLKSRIRVT